ncbi:unnamed protein product [Ectocarpus sp. 12 AP-2014]
MDDAAEAMETILGCLVKGSSPAVIRQVFSMRIREALVCPRCGTSSPEKPATYEANVFYAHVSALREAREKTPGCPFDVALREASHGDLVTCRNAGCSLSRRKERLPSQRFITGVPPSVFSLGLVWNNWGPGLVADLLGLLSPVVDLDVVFSRGREHGVAGAEISAGKAQLRGFFCFQVQKHHYVAFVYNRDRQEWLLLDDDQAVPIGPDFAGVLGRCEEDKLHPSLFFFERKQDQDHATA